MAFKKQEMKLSSVVYAENAGIMKESGSDSRLQQSIENDNIDSKYGFERLKASEEKTGWLLNIHPAEILDEDKRLLSAIDYYFIEDNGCRFKVSYIFQPYFYVLCPREVRQDVCTFLGKKFSGFVSSIKVVTKEDLDLDNHLTGLKQVLIKLTFMTMNDLMKVRQPILSAVRRNKESSKSCGIAEVFSAHSVNDHDSIKNKDYFEHLIDIREYDVPYHVRVSIDLKIFVGSWYSVKAAGTSVPLITPRKDLLVWPDCIVLAYDIETTKSPLKFPDAASDQIMMISYMVDGQGYLITNRDIVSEDVLDFEYTPRAEFEGPFIVFNEINEASLIQRFFDHIIEIKPHIFVTYNGDFFDWPFVEARAAIHNMDMQSEIGFSKSSSGCYLSRPAIHMDCLCWVKRDSYLPVGSQNLKAVAKAKLRYDPVELDPEEMCPLAASDPQVLANYSVSDAVATYYLYMKYVHPFIFALCTIIPMEPDEILRKGSGSLCEALLMVEAFHANIVFPNKQETTLNKLTSDGHVLDQETYVGGHVEAIESGVFRADIPCRFRLVPEALQNLIDEAGRFLKFSIEEEENIPLSQVENYHEVLDDIKAKLRDLKETPCRLENPLIYHLDVGAMYPNIILTNRLQPSAMVNEVVCASCDFNKPGSKCQRKMSWVWRGEVMPASRSEYQRIQQQLEMEKFPPAFPGGPARAFNQLNKEERAVAEKKRLQEYCRKAYKRLHETRTEERWQCVCQRENNFYVNTVLSFRDRRYEYKGLLKSSKKELTEAQKKGDPSEIKAANAKAVLYDSLQLAHKCILNSFYGYVMRRGSRWHSMEMAGVVCYTGANIIMRAREIVEQIGRPLELDTDGIWCILPSSFPENYVIKTSNEKKPKITISYPGTILNVMVKDLFTNDQYHDQVSPGSLDYTVRSENSIFFEVDGPYLAMMLPASKEEGKKLKKRYAVFNFDGSLAELKGFEVKRRGELQLVKIFQSSVFEAFLKGNSLETCYASVAKIADYWLDVLYSKASNMPDSELFDLISENRSMSRKLEEYGEQKSTSITTAKRLAEFLGDQMVKDAGLSCKFIISRKPEGAPVTERVIPLAIFQAESSVKHHYLKRWLKDQSMIDFDIRHILDWDYYKERLSGTIQKIITIPAALQGLVNPVPRVHHPDWLHKRVLERTDTLKQRRITDMFGSCSKTKSLANQNVDQSVNVVQNGLCDIEDSASVPAASNRVGVVPVVQTKRKRDCENAEENLHRSWREMFGNPPPRGNTKEEIVTWVNFLKRKWKFQALQRRHRVKRLRVSDYSQPGVEADRKRSGTDKSKTLAGFLKRAQRTLLDMPWQIIHLVESPVPGQFKLWCLVGQDLHMLKLEVPRIFYVNQRSPKEEVESDQKFWCKVNKTLPRSHPSLYLYEYSIPEVIFREHSNKLMADISTPEIEGIYETQVPLDFRAILQLGCVCKVKSTVNKDLDSFSLKQLEFKTHAEYPYLSEDCNLNYIYFYHHKSMKKSMFGIFIPAKKRAYIFVYDTVKVNQMPKMADLYNNERTAYMQKGNSCNVPEENFTFELKFESEIRQVYRQIQRVLQNYKDEKKGPTFVAVQSAYDFTVLSSLIPGFIEFPLVPIHVADVDNLYNALDWQRIGSKAMIRHFLGLPSLLKRTFELARYIHVPVGNIPRDTSSFAADLFYARHLQRHNTILWASPSMKPDLGGHEDDDNRLMVEMEDTNLGAEINNPGAYYNICIELSIDALAVNALLQSPHINELEGTSSSIAFDAVQKTSLQNMVEGNDVSSLTSYDEMASCAHAFKVIRQMVSGWLKEVVEYKTVFADFQIVHFYRWLRNPLSLLYDPALGKILNTLMKKLFLYLVSEFKLMGSLIIFGNFTRLVICTRKKNVPDALAYVEYVVDNIKNKELFHSIDITYKQCWSHLLWLDVANYGGITCRFNDGANGIDQNLSQDESMDRNQDVVIDMNWNIADFLADWCGSRSNFNTVIAFYISAVYESFIEFDSQHTPGNTPIRKRIQTQFTQTPNNKKRNNNEDPPDEKILFVQDLISNKLSQKLFFITQKMHKRTLQSDFNEMNEQEMEDNALFRFSSEKQTPVLQFVKSVCKVLSLDSSCTVHVGKLKRDLLKILNIGEFSPSAAWIDPCVSYLLPEVICKACNHCRDLDLCKDPHQKFQNSKRVWCCSCCSASYNSDDVEQMMINILHTRSLSYVLQDLQCERCKQIKQPNLSNICECGGNFINMFKRHEFKSKIYVFQTIAQIYSLPQLLEYSREIMNNNGWM